MSVAKGDVPGMPSKTRAVIYARYSADRQRETSIDDQVRNCGRWADREHLSVEHVYSDKALSGSVRNRPGYLMMLDHAAVGAFSVLIVDDLSRLSRDDYEMKGALRSLAWQGVRVVGVADGYDSATKGHKIHAGFKGLMNELFLDDLRERTHRGMAGQALKGFNCGGRTYGYRNVPIEDPAGRDAYGRPAVVAVRYEIDDVQAAIVRQIHEMYAAGYSYKSIACELNKRNVPSSRGTRWASSAIKVILENELYRGQLIWNRRVWMKHPDTGKRTYQKRPRSEWLTANKPELRIVAEDTMQLVRSRQARNANRYSGGRYAEPAQRYVFSGLLICAECDNPFVIVAKGRYGCAGHKTRGLAECTTANTVSRHIVEERLLHGIKTRLQSPQCANTFVQAAIRQLKQRAAHTNIDHLRTEIHFAESERDNLLTAVKQGILTPTTKFALEAAEARIATLSEKLTHESRSKAPLTLPDAIKRYEHAVSRLSACLAERVEPAREILRSVLGAPIRIHRRDKHLEAELSHDLSVLLTNSLKSGFDLSGCGGPICHESYRISLAPTPLDSVPHIHRSRQSGIGAKSDD